jgi:hypothetical protein
MAKRPKVKLTDNPEQVCQLQSLLSDASIRLSAESVRAAYVLLEEHGLDNAVKFVQIVHDSCQAKFFKV